MRKLIGSLSLLAWMIVYIGVAAVVGDRIAGEHWIWQAVYFPVAGVAWVIPLRPLLRWMHSQDTSRESPDV